MGLSGQQQGVLYVVATPIGNLEDITYRAVRILSEVDLVAAEDTRHSRKLLTHYGIQTALISYHEHNEQSRSVELLEKLQAGQQLALISDAGTPCIADPGYRLVQACHEAGITVRAVPGPSAMLAALSTSGLPSDCFVFHGYLPSKAKARGDLLRSLRGQQHTRVFYETPHRLTKALADIIEVFGADCQLAVARELTKLHEEMYLRTAGEALDHFQSSQVKGELVLVLAPEAAAPKVSLQEALRRMLDESDLSRREVVKLVAAEYGLSGSDVYRESLKLMKEDGADESESQNSAD